MIRLKEGVRLTGIRPEIVLALTVAEGVWSKHGADDLVITSGVEGKHSHGSEHYAGLAVDLRTRGLRDPAAAALELRERLGQDYDVLHEGAGTSGEHVHVEFDPKLPLSV